MYGVKFRSVIAAAGLASAVLVSACGDDPVAPAPTPLPSTGGTTLKVSAPAIVSPAGGTSLNTRNPTLVLRPALGTYASPSVSYEVQVLTTGGDAVYSRTIAGGTANGQGTLSHLVDSPLNVRTSYRWRARAVAGSADRSVVRRRLGRGHVRDQFADTRLEQRRVPRLLLLAGRAEEPDLPVAGGLSGDGCRPGCGRHHHREGLVGVHPWAHLPADRRR